MTGSRLMMLTMPSKLRAASGAAAGIVHTRPWSSYL
jgi:hypothetical protein